MPDSEKMQRVNKETPCPVCGKPDWCLVAEDGSAAICQRIQEASKKQCGDAGWLHVLSNRHNGHRKRCLTLPMKEQPGDFEQLSRQYQQQLCQQRFYFFANLLGVSIKSLKRLDTGWDGEAYTFPMSNAESQVIGIRRRFPNGYKVSVRESKTGLFIPAELSSEGLLLICEGPTDTAAALDLGFVAIGRPNCNSCVDMTAKFVKGREVIIIGDNDPPKEDGRRPGKEGAEKLAGKLLLHCLCVKIIYPPGKAKDLRQWLRAGLTSGQLQQIIEKEKELQIKISFKD